MSTAPQSFISGISGATEATSIDRLTKFKIAIVGRPKVGKSWLAATFPGNKYFFDFDARKESIAGKPDTFVKTYRDLDWRKPQAFAELEKDIKMFEYNFSQKKPTPEVYVLDSATHMAKAIENDLLKSVSRLKRELKFSNGSIVQIPAGWDVTNAQRATFEDIIGRLYTLGHVIMTFHEEPEKDKTKSTEEDPVYTGQYVIHPFFLRTLLSTFNEVWRVQIGLNQQYQVTVKPTSEFGASTTLLLDPTESPDIAAMIAKHKEKLEKLKNGAKS